MVFPKARVQHLVAPIDRKPIFSPLARFSRLLGRDAVSLKSNRRVTVAKTPNRRAVANVREAERNQNVVSWHGIS